MKTLKKFFNYFFSLPPPVSCGSRKSYRRIFPPGSLTFNAKDRGRYRYSPLHDRRLIAGKRERVKDGTTTKKALEVSVRNAVNLRCLGGLDLQCDCQQMRVSGVSLGRAYRNESIAERVLSMLRHT